LIWSAATPSCCTQNAASSIDSTLTPKSRILPSRFNSQVREHLALFSARERDAVELCEVERLDAQPLQRRLRVLPDAAREKFSGQPAARNGELRRDVDLRLRLLQDLR